MRASRVFQTIAASLLIFCAPTKNAAETVADEDAQTIAPLEIFQDCADCPEMIRLPMGSFVMGAPLTQSAYIASLWRKPKPGEPLGWAHEGPEHEVAIDIPIAIGRHEVTIGNWNACVDDAWCVPLPSQRITIRNGHITLVDPQMPVIRLTYSEKLDYINWLNRKLDAEAYRLPTEAEWEYAARAGTRTAFAQGDTLNRDQANIGQFMMKNGRYVSVKGNHQTPVPVHTMDAANAWGIRHIAGNLLETTLSCWSDRHLGLATSSAYLAQANDSTTCRRVVKGGFYRADAQYARPANRGATKETSRSSHRGFRVAKEINVAR